MKKVISLLLIVIGLKTAHAQQAINFGSQQINPKAKVEVLKVLDQYLTAFNAKDLTAWERTYQFPHYRLASGKMSVLEKAGFPAQ